MAHYTNRYKLVYDPGPDPLATGLILSNHDLEYGLTYQSFNPGTQIMDTEKGIVFMVINMNKPNVTLKQVLRELHDKAENTPGRIQSVYLQRGLKIEIMIRGSEVHFRISRGSRKPSTTEWNTCLAALPYETEKIEPNSNQVKGRYYLSQKWTLTQKQLL